MGDGIGAPTRASLAAQPGSRACNASSSWRSKVGSDATARSAARIARRAIRGLCAASASRATAAAASNACGPGVARAESSAHRAHTRRTAAVRSPNQP